MKRSPRRANPYTLRTLTICALLFCACYLVGAAAPENDAPGIDMQRYEEFTFARPMQERLLMAYVLHWAKDSQTLITIGNRLHRRLHVTPEIVAIKLINIASMLVIAIVAWALGRRLLPADVWWLPPALSVLIVAVEAVVRDEYSFVQPYDFPSWALFSIGIWACFRKKPLWLLTVVAIGTFNRETTLFLAPIYLALNRKSWFVPLVATTVWIADRHIVLKRVSTLPISFGRWSAMHTYMPTLILPTHWPQLLSVGGFLAIPLWWGRASLPSSLRAAWIGSVPFLLACAVFGDLLETRIFGEITVLIALTASVELTAYMRRLCSTPMQPT